jgi:hypothetical protein
MLPELDGPAWFCIAAYPTESLAILLGDGALDSLDLVEGKKV